MACHAQAKAYATECWRGQGMVLCYVRMREKKYRPARANTASGLQAAMAAGSRFTSPICLERRLSAQYAMAIPKLMPTPAMAPRLPAKKANGMEIMAMISANKGTANLR